MIVYERSLESMFLWMGAWPGEETGVASTMKPEMGSVLERQLSVMLESRTSERRTRRGGLMSGGRGRPGQSTHRTTSHLDQYSSSSS